MLWFRAWLETRQRVAFTVIWSAFFIGVLAMAAASRGEAPDRGGATGREALVTVLSLLAFPGIFVPLWLAGSGVRTQPGLGRNASKGVHGSTHFTLSLPVTRARLLMVRGALGLVAAAGLLLVMGVATWQVIPALSANATPIEGLQHLMVVFVCGTAFYGLAVLTATLLDDTWHMWTSALVLMVLWAPPVRRLLPPGFDVFRPLVDASPIVTHTVPWATMAVAVAVGGVFVLAALRVVQAQEY
jgi:hypothetical protein